MRACVLTAALAPLILTACGGGDSTGNNSGVPTFMSKTGSDPAYVVAGASFSDSIRVHVTDGSNKPASGASVSFDVIAGGGSVTPATVVANANGDAAAKFITGATPGMNSVIATVTGVSAVPAVSFSITTVVAGTVVWSSILTDTLRGVWGTSATDVWAVGYHGALKHFNGTTWTNFTSGTTEPLVAVWGTSPSNVWIVGGFDGTILHYNGTTWSSALERGQPGILFGVWGGSASDLWVVGDVDSVLHYNGTTWSDFASITPTIFGMWGNSASDIWAVGYVPGYGGTIFHYNGATWSSVSPETTLGLSGVWGTSASDVWAAGQNGVIVHYNGTSWSSVSSPTSQGLVSVWGASASDVWAVGYSGAIVHYNGTGWSNVTSGTTQDLFGVWGSSGSDIWAVGTQGLLHGVAAR
jgi:hypothetical protein